jgi:predicted permease
MRLMEVGVEGRVQAVAGAADAADGYLSAAYAQVSTNYLGTMGISLVRGRDFAAEDRDGSTPVVIINETLASRLWGGANSIGKRLRLGREGDYREVIGIARNGRYLMLNEEPRPFLYVPLAQDYTTPVTLHLRAQADAAAMIPSVRQALAALDPNLPLYNTRTMAEHLRQSALALMPLRMAAALAGVQGLLGLCLAIMGIYGVVAYVVGQRTREIGIRVALGATRFDVLRLVVQDGWRLTLIGLVAGLAVALLMALGLSRLLYGLDPMNVAVFLGAVTVVAGVALVACYLPARRALRVDPVLALRSE